MAESSFQIIHNWSDLPNVLIANCIRLVFDEYYKEVSHEEALSFVNIKYNYKSNNDKYICCFEFAANLDDYDLHDYGSFYDKIKDELLNVNYVQSIIKLNDDSRLEEYTMYYRQIANMEMQVREIITLILADCLNGNYYNLLQSQKVNPLLKVKKEDKELVLKERAENELFYLTFNHYKQITVPDHISIVFLKELISEFSNEEIKSNISNLRIFNAEIYRDFLASIQEDLSSLEHFRNCIAHNRKYTNEEWGNYDKAYTSLDNSLKNFWKLLLTDTIDDELL